MSLRIDSRTGSKELVRLFMPYGIAPILTRLEFGDLSFHGNGPHGQLIIAIERKQIAELVQAIDSGRLAGYQLPGMCNHYDVVYLFIEGIWRPDRNGEVEIQNGRWNRAGMSTRRVNAFLTTLEMKAGLIYRRVSSPEELVSTIVDLYRWWQQDWDEHKSHDTVYTGVEPRQFEGNHRMVSLRPREITLTERIALQLPGLQERARYAAQHWPSVQAMLSATLGDWAAMPWIDKNKQQRKLGLCTAKKIVEALQHDKEGSRQAK